MNLRTERRANEAVAPGTLASQSGSAQADRVEITQVIQTAGVSSITGTANQVVASASVGSVTLSLPQSIHTGASPTFADLTLSTPMHAPYRVSSTTVNLNSATAQDLYLVPTGKSFIAAQAIARSASVDISAYASDVPLKDNGSGDAVINAFTATQWGNLSDSSHFIPSSGFDGTDAPYKIVPSGNKVRAIPAGAFGSAATVVIDLFGYLF